MSDESIPSVQEAISEPSESAEQAVDSTSQENGEQAVAAEAVATLNDPSASKVEKKAAQKMLKKLTLKIDGEEYEENLPFEIPDTAEARDYMRRELQMGKMGQKRAQEKSQIEKEVVKFIEDLRKDPRKALSDPAIGLDLKQLATQIIEEEIENSKKSPAQLEKEKLMSELQALKDEREKEKTNSQQKEMERLKEEAYERYDILMTQTLEKSDLPKSPYVIKKMADYMLLGLQNGKDITPEDVLPLVREEIQEDLKQMFAVMPDEVVEKLIGKDKLDSLRKKNIQRAKQAPAALKAGAKTSDTGRVKVEAKDIKDKQTFKDFFKM